MKCPTILLASALMLQTAAASAQIAISSNDGKTVPADAPDAPRTADSLTVLKLGRQVEVLAVLPVPGTVVGPPGSVAVARDSRMAIVTAGQVLNGAGALVSGDVVSVIDLADARHPRLAQSLRAGMGAAGVAISPSGKLALVANTADDSVSVFAIADMRLTPVGTIALEPKSRPVDLGFLNDSAAMVVAQGRNSLIPLRIEGATASRSGPEIAVGAQPYSLALASRTQTAFVSHLGGRAPSAVPGPKPGSIGIVDLRAGRMVDQVDTGITPEHVGLSPRGRYLQVTVNNGTTAPASSPAFHAHGMMVVYRVDGTHLERVAETRTGRWCQGAVWSDDERQILLQCARAREIEVYRFDGHRISPAPGGPVGLDARPGAIATARSR